MVISQTAATQNNNKCPHGFPINACPICSGMMGAPKDKNKARKPGEMTYNECLAAWHKIQAAKEMKLQEKIDKLEKMNQEKFQDKLSSFLDKSLKSIENFSKTLNLAVSKLPAVLKIPAKILIVPFIKLASFSLNVLKNVVNFTFNAINNISRMVNSAVEKLSSFFGEIKNALDFKKSIPKLKKALKSVLSLLLENKEDDEDKEEKKEKIEKTLKGLFKIKTPKEKEKEKEKENEHHHNR